MSLSLDAHSLGNALTVAQKLAIRNSLLKIKIQQKLKEIQFWGKINGAQSDYFIAVSTTIGQNISKSFFWSNDEGATFAQLPAPDEFVSAKSGKIRGMLSGNPSMKHKDPDAPQKVDEEGQPIDDEEEEEEEEEPAPEEEELDEDGNPIPRAPAPRKLNELERLSWMVREIDAATALVPRGSVYMTALGEYQRNNSFTGLSAEQARTLSNFQILRPPTQGATLASIRKAGVTNHHDCLDALAPRVASSASSSAAAKGESWALHVGESGMEVSLRSLEFPGFEFTLEAGTSNYGGAYFGNGERNVDLLFML